MFTPPSPTDPKPLLFPAFIYGDKTTCRRKMKAEAKKWGKRYKEGVDFPEPKLVPIAPGSIVFTDESTANFIGDGFSFSDDLKSVTVDSNVVVMQEGRHIQWRLYMVDMLESETSQVVVVPHAERFNYRRAYLSHVCRYPWGALAAATERCLFNRIELAVPRIEGVLRFWEALDTLKYVALYQRPLSLADLMLFYFEGHLAMWVDQPTGDTRSDLRTYVDKISIASEDEIWGRLVKRLRAYADDVRGLKHLEWLKSPGVIETALDAERNTERDQYEELKTGELCVHGGFFYQLDKKYPGAGH